VNECKPLVVGTVALSASDLASLPALEGTVTATAAWRKHPGQPVNLVGSMMVKATASLRVGPVTAPTLLLLSSAAFPVPCMFGHEVQAAGSLAVNNLGGFLSMDIFATIKYHCGVTGAGLLADIRAATDKEIPIGDDFFILSDLAIAAKILQQADGTKFSTGSITGVASIPGAISGLWVAASVTFDSRDMSATVILQAAYTNKFMTIDAVGSFTVNTCTVAGYAMRGDVALDLAPFAPFQSSASVKRHCEAPANAVWSVHASLPSLLMFDGAFELFDVEVAAVGKPIGTVAGRSSNITWTANLAGGARVNW